MNISEKISHANPKEVNLYHEGIFWVAYEQSAYYFWMLKGYTPTKRYVKVLGTDIVSVGFPGSSLEEITGFRYTVVKGGFSLSQCLHEEERSTPVSLALNDNHLVFELEQNIDEEEFLKWKEGLELKNSRAHKFPRHHIPGSFSSSAVSHYEDLLPEILGQIKNFDISHKTPMECMFFLAELKKQFVNDMYE